MYAVPEPGKTTKQFQPSLLDMFGTVLCSDQAVLQQVLQARTEDCQAQVLLLGDFHKRGTVDIVVRQTWKSFHAVNYQDPTRTKDPKSFDKCYWLIYYSVQGFLKQIKEEAQEKTDKQDKKKLHIKDAINHNMNRIKDLPILNIDPSPFFILEVPLQCSQKITPASLSPPQAPPDDIPDIINYSPPRPRHQLIIFDVDQIIPTVLPNAGTESEVFQWCLSPPQAPTEDYDDIPNTVNNPVKIFWQETGPESGVLSLPSLHPPKYDHLLPPLHYHVDHDELLFPRTISPAHLLLDKSYNIHDKKKIFLSSIITDISFQPPDTPPCTPLTIPIISMSPPSPPFLPSYPPQDTVNYPPSCNLNNHPVSPHITQLYYPPSPPQPRQLFTSSPPQLVEYLNIEDIVNYPSLPAVNKIPITSDTMIVYMRRPTRPLTITRHALAQELSPPQTPDLPDKEIRRGEDLFDQVRRTSRAFNTFLF